MPVLPIPWAGPAVEGFKCTYVWSADGEVAIDGHHRQQADAGHAKENVESRVDLEAEQKKSLYFHSKQPNYLVISCTGLPKCLILDFECFFFLT